MCENTSNMSQKHKIWSEHIKKPNSPRNLTNIFRFPIIAGRHTGKIWGIRQSSGSDTQRDGDLHMVPVIGSPGQFMSWRAILRRTRPRI